MQGLNEFEIGMHVRFVHACRLYHGEIVEIYKDLDKAKIRTVSAGQKLTLIMPLAHLCKAERKRP